MGLRAQNLALIIGLATHKLSDFRGRKVAPSFIVSVLQSHWVLPGGLIVQKPAPIIGLATHQLRLQRQPNRLRVWLAPHSWCQPLAKLPLGHSYSSCARHELFVLVLILFALISTRFTTLFGCQTTQFLHRNIGLFHKFFYQMNNKNVYFIMVVFLLKC